TVVSRIVNPSEPTVVSVTQFHAGDTYNVIPNEVQISGCTRCFSPRVQKQLEPVMKRIAKEISSAWGANCDFRYERRYPPTINTEQEALLAGEVAAEIVGAENVNLDPKPSMGSEDFAFLLQEKPGAYLWIGNGDGEGSCMVHNPGYDFNDNILPIGATWFVRMAEKSLPPLT
ncbi:MAG: M20/M25/M40 family metallo-hydrolase, partial [Gammaproteobacteria bacterium]|nr:M20/M25/M40 family metallo-hydrolase [Gammaproteobacteria bacterium]